MPRPEEHLSPGRPLADGEAERIAERMAAFATASRLKLLYALVGRELGVDGGGGRVDGAGSAGPGGRARRRTPSPSSCVCCATCGWCPCAATGGGCSTSSTTTISSTCWARSGTSSSTPSAAGSTRRRVSMSEAHGHSHGLVDRSITRSRAGLRAVALSLVVLLVTGVAQIGVFVASGSVALLADLIHNVGDALTAVPLAVAFLLRSARAERGAGYVVVAVIFFSACVAAFQAVDRLIHPQDIDHLLALALAGVVGFLGNEWAAAIRLRAGPRRLRGSSARALRTAALDRGLRARRQAMADAASPPTRSAINIGINEWIATRSRQLLVPTRSRRPARAGQLRRRCAGGSMEPGARRRRLPRAHGRARQPRGGGERDRRSRSACDRRRPGHRPRDRRSSSCGSRGKPGGR